MIVEPAAFVELRVGDRLIDHGLRCGPLAVTTLDEGDTGERNVVVLDGPGDGIEEIGLVADEGYHYLRVRR